MRDASTDTTLVAEAGTTTVRVEACAAQQQLAAAKAPLRGNVYEVSRLLARREGTLQEEFLVEWAGFPLSDASWEPRSHIMEEVIRAFEVTPLATPACVRPPSRFVIPRCVPAGRRASRGERGARQGERSQLPRAHAQAGGRLEQDAVQHVQAQPGPPKGASPPAAAYSSSAMPLTWRFGNTDRSPLLVRSQGHFSNQAQRTLNKIWGMLLMCR